MKEKKNTRFLRHFDKRKDEKEYRRSAAIKEKDTHASYHDGRLNRKENKMRERESVKVP